MSSRYGYSSYKICSFPANAISMSIKIHNTGNHSRLNKPLHICICAFQAMSKNISIHAATLQELQQKCSSDYQTFADLRDPVTEIQVQLRGLQSCLDDISATVTSRWSKLKVRQLGFHLCCAKNSCAHWRYLSTNKF